MYRMFPSRAAAKPVDFKIAASAVSKSTPVRLAVTGPVTFRLDMMFSPVSRLIISSTARMSVF